MPRVPPRNTSHLLPRRSIRLTVVHIPVDDVVFNTRTALEFFATEGPLCYMLSFLPLSTVSAVSQSSKRYREIVKGMFRRRLRMLLEPFFAGEARRLDKVFRLLRSSNSGVGGSIALAMLDCPWSNWTGRDVNIFAPFGCAYDWDRLLRVLGFVHVGGKPNQEMEDQCQSHREYRSTIVSYFYLLDRFYAHVVVSGRLSGYRDRKLNTIMD